MSDQTDLPFELARRLGLKRNSFTVRQLVRLPEWAFPEAFCRRVLNRAGRIHGHEEVARAYAAAGGRYEDAKKARRIGLYAAELRACVLKLPVACQGPRGIERSCGEERETA
jgi:hypothetical protein